MQDGMQVERQGEAVVMRCWQEGRLVRELVIEPELPEVDVLLLLAAEDEEVSPC